MRYFNIFSFIIAVSALMIAYFRCTPLTMDWVSIVVGALAIMVALLLGFNFLSVIDFRQKIKEQERTNKAELEKLNAAVSLNFIQISDMLDNYSNYYIKKKPMGEFEDFFYLYYKLNAIVTLSATNAEDVCLTKIDALINDINSGEYAIPLKDKEALIKCVTRVTNSDRFNNLPTLIDKIASLTTFEL